MKTSRSTHPNNLRGIPACVEDLNASRIRRMEQGTSLKRDERQWIRIPTRRQRDNRMTPGQARMKRMEQGTSLKRDEGQWIRIPTRRQKDNRMAPGQGVKVGMGPSTSGVIHHGHSRRTQNSSVGSRRGYSEPKRNAADIVQLYSRLDWENLQMLGSSEVILDKLIELKSDWIPDFHENVSQQNFFEFSIFLNVLNKIDDKFRSKKLSILTDLFTAEYISSFAQFIASNPWKSNNCGEVLRLIQNLRQNIEYCVCFEPRFRSETYVESLQELMRACTELLHLRSEEADDPDKLTEEVSNFMNILLERNVELSLYPYNFQEPLIWEPNKKEGAFASGEHYVQTHFNLLKEDFQMVLRDGINAYIKEPTAKNLNMWRYEGVTLIRVQSRNRGKNILFYVQFPERLTNYLTSVPWGTGKRFVHGSLVVLSADHFQTYNFATVEALQVNKRYPKVFISFVTHPPKIEETTFVLVEPKAFFPPYYYSMMVLKKMLTTGVPFERYIVKADVSDANPAYLNKSARYHIASRVFNVCYAEQWPQAATLSLNDSQRNAFIRCITSEFSVIQGPPGTGKTFLAVKVLCTLLENRNEGYREGPILVVALKNHSLDQMLERLVKNGKHVVRIGGQSKSDLLKSKNARLLRYSFLPPHIGEMKTQSMEQLQNSLMKVNYINDQINLIRQKSGIIKLEVFKNHDIVDKGVHISMDKWLLKCLFNQDLPIVSEDEVSWSATKLRNYNYMGMHQVDLRTLAARMIYLQRNIDGPSNGGKAIKMVNEYWRLRHYFCILHGGLEFLKRKDINTDSPRLDVDSQMFPGFEGLTATERWSLYWSWETSLLMALESDLRIAMTRLSEAEEAYQRIIQMQMYCRLKEANPDVIGITTTGAASHHFALSMLGPRIVLIEEAAEVLEANIITSLSSKCEHLILIGDHQQLKPSTYSHEIATKGHLNVSLFERMIHNQINMVQLNVQHRMRPEIAALISPSIYADLKNSPSTAEHPNVRGMMKNVFFFSHNNVEIFAEESSSIYNPGEAAMVRAVANYLWMQGYEDSKITILSFYAHQDSLIKTLIKTTGWNFPHWTVTTVDNYQGEENDIVLLSLVRSNIFGQIGFLKDISRVCVALSRAKNGLYIFGNESCFRQNEPSIWMKTFNVLSCQEAIGDLLPLKCTTHGTVTNVSGPEDLGRLQNGGCAALCALPLNCGHSCEYVCHGYDLDHKEKFVCGQPCLRKCEEGHSCQARCCDKCPKCTVLIERTLSCQHTRQLECHLEPDRIYCVAKIRMNMELCGHVKVVSCRRLIKSTQIDCTQDCKEVLKCGHTYRYKCHTKRTLDFSKVVCFEKCLRRNELCSASVQHMCQKECGIPCGQCEVTVDKEKPGCGHIISMKCHENPSDVMCEELCRRKLKCGHNCVGLCFQECNQDSCCEMVEKTIESCGHKILARCCTEQAILGTLCNEPCRKTKSCGHTCSGPCKDDCNKYTCEVPVPFSLLCGHQKNIPCYVEKEKHPHDHPSAICKIPCDAVLPCGHRCKGTCEKCAQGKFHVPCLEPCGKELICNHPCPVKCSALYHSCPNKKCTVTNHKEEIKFRQNSTEEQQWFKNQNILHAMRMELQQRLMHYLSSLKPATYFENDAVLSALLLGMWKSFYEKKRKEGEDESKNACDQISSVKGSIVKAEFLFVFDSIMSRCKSYNMNKEAVFKKRIYWMLLKSLATIAASRNVYVSVHEILQLQQLTVWTSLMVDYHAICEVCKRTGKKIQKPDNLDCAYTSESVRVEAHRDLLQQVQAAFNVASLSITSPYVVDMFPLSTELALPSYHHIGGSSSLSKPRKSVAVESNFEILSSTYEKYSDLPYGDNYQAELVDKLENLSINNTLPKFPSDDELDRDIPDNYYNASDDESPTASI